MALLQILVPIAVPGCSREPTAPLLVRGTYVLRTVGDSTLPYLARSDSVSQVWVVADTLRFDGRARVTFTEVARRVTFVSPGGAIAQIEVVGQGGTLPYTVRDSTVVFGASPCRDQPSLCAYTPEGMLLPDGRLELASSLAPPEWYFSSPPWFFAPAGG